MLYNNFRGGLCISLNNKKENGMTLSGLKSKRSDINKKIDILESYQSKFNLLRTRYNSAKEYDKQRKNEFKISDWKGRRSEKFCEHLEALYKAENSYHANGYQTPLSDIKKRISELKSDRSDVQRAINNYDRQVRMQ